MLPDPTNTSSPRSPVSPSTQKPGEGLCFSNLRGVKWRVHLGVLPSSPSSTVEDFRQAVAKSRRRYASLRHHLLVDPHISKDGNETPNLILDNPLSLHPDSMWCRFFSNAELEKMVNVDLSRLYPEEGNFFQTPACQAMLRRVLLLWCLKHPVCGYRQGMHELLAPLLYVLHVDVQHLSEVQKKYRDHFVDEFDGMFMPESVMTSDYRFTKRMKGDDLTDEENDLRVGIAKQTSLDDLDPETRGMILLSHPYGTEGELGVLLSEKFLEHDAYCMFDALMDGEGGLIAMAEFFSSSPVEGSITGLSPVIEASLAMYNLLSVVDSSIHGHLIGLGVEPQYFGMRWIRLLFGREFSLDKLLVIWDEIFSSPNCIYNLDEENIQHPHFKMLASARGAFISAVAVAMILHLRSSLLATQNATSCLQKLLDFPENIDLKMLMGKAKSLQIVALGADFHLSSASCKGFFDRDKPSNIRHQGLLSGCVSPKTQSCLLPESYWEKKWSVLHRAEEPLTGTQTQTDPVSSIIKGICSGKFGLSREESDPSASKNCISKKGFLSSIRQEFSNNLSRDSHLVESEIQGTEVNSTVESEADGAKEGCNGSDFLTVMEENLNLRVENTRLSCKQDSESSVDSNIFICDNEVEGCNSCHNITIGGLQENSVTTFGSSEFSEREKSDEQKLMGTLRNLGQSMLENIQVIESTFQQTQNHSACKFDVEGLATVMEALRGLRRISGLLLEM